VEARVLPGSRRRLELEAEPWGQESRGRGRISMAGERSSKAKLGQSELEKS